MKHLYKLTCLIIAATVLIAGCRKRHDPEPPPVVPPTALQLDSLALVGLYNAANGDAWTTKWTLTAPLDQWPGVTMANGRVTQLNLPENNLTGTLPENIGTLTELQYLDLHENNLAGVAPAALNKFTQLEFLDLSDNKLSGAFPGIPALTQLLVFDVFGNNLTALPALHTHTALEYLAFGYNSLAGALPANLSALTQLIHLDASGNSFTGHIPPEWSAFTRMKAFCLYRNSLTGEIPEYLADFPNLEDLMLFENNLTGNIPARLLNHPLWSKWQPDVCPQKGAGFGNCSNSGAPAPKRAQAQRRAVAAEYKARIYERWLKK